MRKHQQKQILEMIATLEEARIELSKHSSHQTIVALLGNCQDFVVEIGEFIEEIKGEGTQTVEFLEKYHQLLFEASTDDDLKRHVKQLRKQLIIIETSVKTELKPDKFAMVFFPYKASMWDSMESIYLTAKDDPMCEVYVVTIPYFDKLPTGAFGEMHYEGQLFPDYVEITDWQSFNVEAMHPDVIFVHNPYDEGNYVTSVHPEFYCKKLRDMTDMLVYVPYFISNGVDENCVTINGCIYSHYVITQSEKDRKDYIEIYNQMCKQHNLGDRFGKAEEKFLALGSPKFDKVVNSKREDFTLPEKWEQLITKPDKSRKKVVLYNTNIISLLSNNEKVLEKLKYVFDTFKKQDDSVLWWRPHPLNKTTVESMRPGLLMEYNGLVEQFKQEGFGIYDDTPDLHRALSYADAYYGDGGSLFPMFALTGKPLMRQDVDALGEDMIVDKYLLGPLTESGDHLWAVMSFCNTVVKLDKSSLEVIKTIPIPDKELLCFYRYIKVIEYENKLILVPCASDYIAIMDIDTSNFEFIKLKDIDNGVNKDENYKFIDAFHHEDNVYFTPYMYPAIVSMNLKTKKLTYYNDCFDELNQLPKTTDNTLFRQCIRVDNILYMPCMRSNVVVTFDMDTKSAETHRLNETHNGFSSICYDGKYFWLVQMKNYHTFIRWDYCNQKVKELLIFPKEFKNYSVAFSNPVYDGESIWLIPFVSNMAFRFDTIKEEIGRINELEIECKWGLYELTLYNYTNFINSKLLLQSYNKSVVVEYDLLTSKASEKKLIVSDTSTEILDKMFKKVNNLKPYSFYYIERCYTSPGTIGLGTFIENITDLQTDKNKFMKEYDIQNTDGTAGAAIYNYCKARTS